jgi:hypothetical protein
LYHSLLILFSSRSVVNDTTQQVLQACRQQYIAIININIIIYNQC